MWRDAYQKFTDPELFLGAGEIRALMAKSSRREEHAAAPDLAVTLDRVSTWSAEQTRVYYLQAESARDTAQATEFAHTILRQSAVLASTLGCWLQGMSAPGIFEDEVALKVMALLADDVGVGRPRSSRYDEFKILSRHFGRPDLAVEPAELVAVHAIRDHMFALPAVLLAISRRGDEFAPVIAGIDVVMRTVGAPAWWSALRELDEAPIEWDQLNLRVPTGAAGLSEPLELSRWVAERFSAVDADYRRRVELGAAWAFDALTWWNDMLLDEVHSALCPNRAMAVLVGERARQGSLYHQKLRLGDHYLSQLMKRATDDPEPLLTALAHSAFVKPGDAAHSSLVNGLLGPKGPMFRIFKAEDVDTISRWIDALPDAGGQTTPSETTHTPSPPDLDGADDARGRATGVVPADIREAYFVLQGRALAPATREFAIGYVKRWLVRARMSLDRTDRSLPKQWTSAGLRPWLLDMHDKHGAEFESGKDADLPSRAEVIDSTLQLAPLTLIDGAWLQGFTEATLASSGLGFPLFETYWDELGNGETSLNHPKIYRDVLRQMGVELPRTGTREFAQDPRLRDESFRLPVYWLCLGKLPFTFMPEILGMNLAMELSGVGGSYRRARIALRHYGFSTQFVDIHNTIDNVSTGHSAWAADAIDTHMRAIARLSDPDKLAAEWKRVRTGYESLEPLPSKMGKLIGYRFRFRAPHGAKAADQPLFHHTPVLAS